MFSMKLHNGARDPSIIQEPQFPVVRQQDNPMCSGLGGRGSSLKQSRFGHLFRLLSRYSQPLDRFPALRDSVKIRRPPVSLFRVLSRNLPVPSFGLVNLERRDRG